MTAALLPLALALAVAPPTPPAPAPAPTPTPRVSRGGGIHPFSLTGRDGRTVTLADLRGKVWVASFVVTRCKDGKCPQVTETVRRLQKDLAGVPNVLLVTFTVDPEDGPAELERYASGHDADPQRWLFLTGDKSEIHELLLSFHLRGPANKPGDVDHAQKLILVDHAGEVRGYFDGLDVERLMQVEDTGQFEQNYAGLKKSIHRLVAEVRPGWMPMPFPTFNAVLNGVAAALICAGWCSIRAGLRRLHVICMLSALATSALFLASYLYYHLSIKAGVPTGFRDVAPEASDAVVYLYKAILTSHTILAVVATPLVLVSAYLGLRDRLRGHVRLARWTMPIWLYVSVTGVVVYWMLYRAY
jgi:protein SCO1/2/putative membrane protein